MTTRKYVVLSIWLVAIVVPWVLLAQKIRLWSAEVRGMKRDASTEEIRVEWKLGVKPEQEKKGVP